jgi:thioredoxin reductase
LAKLFTRISFERIPFTFMQQNHMTTQNNVEVIIIGGSYAGLSAAMALGRSLRNVLIIDSGMPCNRQTPHSHNFITHDGETPKAMTEKAKEQVLAYDTVQFHRGLAVSGMSIKNGIPNGMENGFEITTENGATFTAQKLLFATGVLDMLDTRIKGLEECWGISVLHCPYCHGYEVRHQRIGIIANGETGFELARLISNWTNNLTLFTNGQSTLTTDQTERLQRHTITVVEHTISALEHQHGAVRSIVFDNGSRATIDALFTRPAFRQHCDIPQMLGCAMTEQGYVQVDGFHRTSVHGVYAAGDNASMMRALSAAVATGTMAGAFINKELIEESF